MTKSKKTDRFMWDDGILVSQCMLCKHRSDDADEQVCDAFPKGIPDEIIANEFDHRDKWTKKPGDKGIQFEARDGVSDESLEMIDHHFKADR